MENLPGVKSNEPLAPYTNFKIGGPAKFFFQAKSTQDVVSAAQVAAEIGVPFMLIGGGTNLVVADKGFPGLVVQVKSNTLLIEGTQVTADAGVALAYLVQQSVSHGLTGLEPLVAVPGTVGGAVYGNAGVPQITHGFIGDFVQGITALRGDTIQHLTQAECKFGYRDSAFKHGSDVILQVVLGLEQGNKEESQALIQKYIASRKSQPYDMPSSGCIFTNVAITNPEEVKQKFNGEEKLEGFMAKGQLPASWLIDMAGLKGKTIGGIQVSEKHANYLVNTGSGTADQVVQMISYIKQQVRDKFGIELMEEVRNVGF